MSRHIEIEFEGVDPVEMRRALPGVQFESPDKVSPVRSPDLLVALVGAGGVALGAFLKGLFDLAVAKGASKIALKAADGTSLEAPANLSEQRFAHLLKQLQDLNLKRVQIL
jgi:hypothetical protein